MASLHLLLLKQSRLSCLARKAIKEIKETMVNLEKTAIMEALGCLVHRSAFWVNGTLPRDTAINHSITESKRGMKRKRNGNIQSTVMRRTAGTLQV